MSRMGPREALLAVTAPRPAFFCPLPAESRRPRAPGQSETRRHGPLRPPGGFGGGPRLQGPVAAPCPPHPGSPWVPAAPGGRRARRSPQRYQAASSIVLTAARVPWLRLDQAGGRRAEGPGAARRKGSPRRGGQLPRGVGALVGSQGTMRGISAPQLHSCTSSRQPSSYTASSSRDWEPARSRLAPPPPPTTFQQVPGSGSSGLHFLPPRAQARVRPSPRRDARGARSPSRRSPWGTPKRRGGDCALSPRSLGQML